MKYNPLIKYFKKVQEQIETERYTEIIDDLFYVPESQLEALWNFLVAGYPVNFAVQNYINLYDFANENSLDYPTAIETFYSISYGVNAGINLNELEWFEFN